MNVHTPDDLLDHNYLAPSLSRVRSQSPQPVRQFTTARSNYATATHCGFSRIIYLPIEASFEGSSAQASIVVDQHYCSLFLRGARREVKHRLHIIVQWPADE